jgi:hypothetical protein
MPLLPKVLFKIALAQHCVLSWDIVGKLEE